MGAKADVGDAPPAAQDGGFGDDASSRGGEQPFLVEHGSGMETEARAPLPDPPSRNGFETSAESIAPGGSGTIEPGVVSLDASPTSAHPETAEGSGDSLEPGVVSLTRETVAAPPPPQSAPPARPSAPPAFMEPAAPAPTPPSAPAAPAAPAARETITFESQEPPAPAHAPHAEPAHVSHEELAATYLSAGKQDLAVEEFWKAAELAFFRGDLPRARTLLGSLLQISPQHEAALRRQVDITSQSEDRPEEARARFDLAELYLSQEEWALARAEYLRVLEIDGTNDRARMRVQRLDALMHAAPAPGENVDFDAIDVPKPAASVRVRDEGPSAGDSLIDLEEIIDEFKQGVQNSISGEDHESHYDLGMAYMEMGLYDEAISEFQIAQKGAPIELKSLEMIALCYLEKSEPAEAVRELTRALELPGHGPDETISIRYNLGMAHERLGNLDRALQHYEEVHVLNVDFLKVSTKVRELKQRLSGSRDLG
jgi:tetratricopeptide (TPR) repeat protein